MCCRYTIPPCDGGSWSRTSSTDSLHHQKMIAVRIFNGGPTGSCFSSMMSQGNFATSALVSPHCCSLCLLCMTGLSSTLSLSVVWPTYRADKNYSFHPVFQHKIDYCELAVNQRGTFLYWVMYPV